MPFDLAGDHVQRVMASWPHHRSEDAQAAWDWLTASGDATAVSLHDLEYFLWYSLPAKFLTEHDHHVAVARALGDLLRALGYEDAADLCQGLTTMRVLGEWKQDPSRGHRAFIKALEGSGVQPPDTDALEWSTVMMSIERSAFVLASHALEDALLRGIFTPGERGWKQAQAEVTRHFLVHRRHEFDERTPQEAVWHERQEQWARPPHRPARQAWLQAFARDLHPVRDPPQDAAASLLPLRRLLELVGTGVPLTQAGFIPPSLARQLVDEFGWRRTWERPPRSEADAIHVQVLRNAAQRSGLLRAHHRQLRVTDAGRRALADVTLLWSSAVRMLAAGTDFSHAIGELLLARLLERPDNHDRVREDLVPVLAEAGWRPSDDGPLSADIVSGSMWDAVRPLELLGMLHVAEWPERGICLTEFGAASARAILWHRAIAPVERVW